MEYKATLNLPKTDFPMKADLPVREPERLEQWGREDVYRRLLERRAGRPEFVLHDGPPFANNDLHMGTALNMALKDLVLKSRSMAGFRVPYVPGWDCHGLPIEHKVMKESGAGAMSPAEVRAKCAAYARKFMGIQGGQRQRLGVLGEWNEPYYTMAPGYEAEILRVFATLVGKGLVYRGLRPVHWSTGCRTALAEAEIEYQPKTDLSVYVKFPLADAAGAGLPDDTAFLVWTTTPWTLPANLALAVAPGLVYGLFETARGPVIALVPRAAKVPGFEPGAAPARTWKGAELEGWAFRHPFLERAGKVFGADFVTDDTGTGIVHIAPGHGQDDYALGREKGLAVLSPVDDAGRLTAEAGLPELAGTYVFDANPKIRDLLRDRGALWADEEFAHDYPHCWRSKTPTVFRAVQQWFIRVDAIREEALRAIDGVTWVPAWGRNRIRGAVESRPDWCISRQRTWGVPIPVFFRADGEPVLEERVIRRFADFVEKHGTDLWFLASDSEMARALGLGPGLEKGRDTLDVWIDSGVSHAAVVRKRLRFPADLYLEGSDQHRGWFQSSLLTSVAACGVAPFKQVLTHGFVLDEDRKKISKSATYEKPMDLMSFVNRHGADVVRLWVASQDFRDDVPFSEEIFQRVAETYRSIRNTLRILLGNLAGFDAARDAVAWDRMTSIDRHILLRLQAVEAEVIGGYDRYEFHVAYHALNRFCAVDLSAFYVDVLKDRMYCDAARSERRRSAQTAMREAASSVCRLLAPMAPFTADEAWRAMGNQECVHLEEFPKPGRFAAAPGFEEGFHAILGVREKVNAALEPLRREKRIGKSLEAAVEIGTELLSARDAGELAEIFNVSQVAFMNGDGVRAFPAEGKKCVRCWRVLPDVGVDAAHPELCPRCVEAHEMARFEELDRR